MAARWQLTHQIPYPWSLDPAKVIKDFSFITIAHDQYGLIHSKPRVIQVLQPSAYCESLSYVRFSVSLLTDLYMRHPLPTARPGPWDAAGTSGTEDNEIVVNL